ncbi:Srrm2 protein [Gorgonomyces haynaldii]|nr:Srrm2 protein [Gorgonomyces haynaldii]
MYNGIGLQTARGSGTNGYVQRNLSSIKPKQFHRNPNYDRPPTKREPDPEIIEHEKKRRVEIQVLELQDQLEEEGLSENEIIEKTDALRQQLLKDLHKIVIRNEHQSLLDKQKMDSKLQRAFGIEDDYVEGSAFDENFQVCVVIVGAEAVEKAAGVGREAAQTRAAVSKARQTLSCSSEKIQVSASQKTKRFSSKKRLQISCEKTIPSKK